MNDIASKRYTNEACFSQYVCYAAGMTWCSVQRRNGIRIHPTVRLIRRLQYVANVHTCSLHPALKQNSKKNLSEASDIYSHCGQTSHKPNCTLKLLLVIKLLPVTQLSHFSASVWFWVSLYKQFTKHCRYSNTTHSNSWCVISDRKIAGDDDDVSNINKHRMTYSVSGLSQLLQHAVPQHIINDTEQPCMPASTHTLIDIHLSLIW